MPTVPDRVAELVVPLELSRPFGVSVLPAAGRPLEIISTAAERAALATRYKIVALPSLTASLRITPVPHTLVGVVRVSGTVQAEVEQVCGVTAEPFVARVDTDLERFYAPPSPKRREPIADEVELDPLADDPPDDIIDGSIDVGELVAEELALALDPFPRKPGVEFRAPPEYTAPDEAVGPDRQRPFEGMTALAGLAHKLKNK